MMHHIFLLEDDAALGHGIELALQNAQTTVCRSHTLAEARRILSERTFDLLILDVNLPDGSGLTLLREVKACTPALPVILLTANDLELDVVTGLEAGADDYITKPFSLAILRARVGAQLRRMKPVTVTTVFRQDGFVFDFDALSFTVDGRAVQLSQTEQRLLRLLTENRGHTVPRDTLIDRIWTDGAAYVDENALSVTVGRLRRKLGANAPIQTMYGVGYGWAVDK